MMIDEAIADWLALIHDTRDTDTEQAYTYALRTFQRWLATQQAPPDLAALRTPLLEAYVGYLKARRLADRTRHQYVDVLLRWITALVDQGELPGIPNSRGRIVAPAGLRDQLLRHLPRPEPAVAPRMPDLRRLPAYYVDKLAQFLRTRHDQPPSERELAAQRTYLNLLRDQTLIGVLFSTGGRVNEVLGLDVSHLFRATTIADAVEITGKGRKKRMLYLGPEVRHSIQAYLNARQPIFPTAVPLFISHGPRARGQRLSDVSAWRIVKEAAEALADLRTTEGADSAEIKALRALSPHSLRHFFAQSMLDEGAEYRDIASALGHSSTAVTEQVYARQGQDEVLEVIATFAARPSLRFRRSDEE